MKVCFPVASDNGMESTIYGHFASSPLFLVIDTKTKQSSIIPNCDKKNPYAGCNPFMALSGKKLDGIVAGGIGDDALRTMNMCGFRVFEAQSTNIAENLELLKKNELPEAVVLFSDRAGRCSDNDGKCNHTHDHDHDHDDHDHDSADFQEEAKCDPSTCNPESCSLGLCG